MAKQPFGIQNRKFPDIEILHDHSAAIGEALEIHGPETAAKHLVGREIGLNENSSIFMVNLIKSLDKIGLNTRTPA